MMQFTQLIIIKKVKPQKFTTLTRNLTGLKTGSLIVITNPSH